MPILHPYLLRSSSRPLSLVSKADGNRSSVDPTNPRQTGISQRLADPLFVPFTRRRGDLGSEPHRYGWSFATPQQHSLCIHAYTQQIGPSAYISFPIVLAWVETIINLRGTGRPKNANGRN